MGARSQKTRNRSDWRRRLNKKEKSKIKKIYQKAKICKKTKSGLSTRMLTSFLAHTRHFLGVYAENQLKNVTVQHYPTTLIVNLDSSDMPGSHWIAIGLFSSKLEIFDSLGFSMFDWPHIPCNLLNFLLKFSIGRKLKVSKPLQPFQSSLCGFYCAFYILARPFMSFKKIHNFFTSNLQQNDKTLINLFQ